MLVNMDPGIAVWILVFQHGFYGFSLDPGVLMSIVLLPGHLVWILRFRCKHSDSSVDAGIPISNNTVGIL